MTNKTHAHDNPGEQAEHRRLHRKVVSAGRCGAGHCRSCCWTTHMWASHRGVLRVHFANKPGLAKARQPENSTLTQESQTIQISEEYAGISTLQITFPSLSIKKGLLSLPCA